MRLHKRAAIILSLGIMLAGLVTYRIDSNGIVDESKYAAANDDTGETGTDSDTPAVTLTPTPVIAKEKTEPTEAPTPTAEPNTLKYETYPDIHKLVEKYLNAKLECTKEAFEPLVTDISYLDFEGMAASTESILSYNDIQCYYKRGYGEIDIVVYCLYTANIVNVDTPVPSIDCLYVSYDASGNPKIFFGEVDDETQNRLNALDDDKEVNALLDYTLQQIEDAIQSDDSFKNFWTSLVGQSEASTEQ